MANNIKAYAGKGQNSREVPFAVSEAYKTLRTNLKYMMSQSQSRSIVISSSVQGEGKSTTTINIAIAFSQLGDRVLVIDGDMRLPTIHKKMKQTNNNGLSTVLAGFDSFDSAIKHFNDHLDVLTAGPLPPNPSELISSENMKALIKVCESRYDYIIIDTPPISVVSDAVALVPCTAGIVLVARCKAITHDRFKKTVAQLELAQAKLLGVVLNGSERNDSSAYHHGKMDYYNYGRYGKPADTEENFDFKPDEN